MTTATRIPTLPQDLTAVELCEILAQTVDRIITHDDDEIRGRGAFRATATALKIMLAVAYPKDIEQFGDRFVDAVREVHADTGSSIDHCVTAVRASLGVLVKEEEDERIEDYAQSLKDGGSPFWLHVGAHTPDGQDPAAALLGFLRGEKPCTCGADHGVYRRHARNYVKP